MARKSKYESVVVPKLDIIEGWARNGLTLEDIAHNLGVSRQSLQMWKSKHEELRKAIENGKEVADIRVENALYRRATGYYSDEEKVVICRDPDGGNHAEVVHYRRYHQADVRAIIFWLKNRMPDKWRDKILELEDVEGFRDILEITERLHGEREISGSVETTA